MTAPAFEPEIDALIGLDTPGEIYGCRLERKLVVAPAVARALRAVVATHLTLEEWLPGRKRTLIHSLYFDTLDFALYRRSLEPGPTPSLKLRLRAYGDAATPAHPDAVPFLEAKLGVTTPDGPRIKRKARLRLTPKKLARLLGAGASNVPISRRKVWLPMLQYLDAHGIHPRLTVSYTREAFQDAEGQLRVTFDEGYRATALAGNASPLSVPHGRLGDHVVVEIKFVQSLPPWLLEALEGQGLPPEGQSFSKFKTAVALLFPGLEGS